MPDRSRPEGFTLVELLVVVVILAVIAAIVVPQFSNASAIARASMLADDLRVIRMQINIFKAQHHGVSPGYPGCDPAATPTEDDLVAHLTQASNSAGQTPLGSEPHYGPYLRDMPPNPVNGKRTVQIILDNEPVPAEADDSHGWIYHPYSLTVKADCAGTDDTGKAYIDY